MFLPVQLAGEQRRRHVRQTIREDHETRIAEHDNDAAAKFAKLHGSLFSFFRGTCLLFYRDMAGEDADMPTVLTLGDVHPENFGVMPSVDDVPIFGVNDFDEAFYAPFTWDLKRGAVGFMIAAAEEGDQGRKKQRRIAGAFVRGYVEAMRGYAADATEQEEQMREDNAPRLIRKLIHHAAKEKRSAWLDRKYHDEHRRGFRADDEHVPVTSRVAEFQAALDAFVVDNDIDVPARTAGMKVKDVCKRLGQGTASLGLPRYYLMIEGPEGDGSDDVLLEFKQARRSALAGLAPPSDFVMDGQAERISHAQGVFLVGGDRFYGAAELDGMSFMVRERRRTATTSTSTTSRPTSGWTTRPSAGPRWPGRTRCPTRPDSWTTTSSPTCWPPSGPRTSSSVTSSDSRSRPRSGSAPTTSTSGPTTISGRSDRSTACSAERSADQSSSASRAHLALSASMRRPRRKALSHSRAKSPPTKNIGLLRKPRAIVATWAAWPTQ